jgi:hypothetical protein
MALETPIAFCIFNRPELTSRVFAAIARQKPKRLLVVADGPRESHPSDVQRVQKARAVLDRIDWPCELQTNFSDVNLGCRQRMATGISWAFEQADELVILEDDCLPDESFFAYCEQLLDRYRHEPQVMMISGNNFQPQPRTSNSYYFSRYTHIWGWASWRRAWNTFDLDMNTWPSVRATRSLASAFEDPCEYEFWKNIFDQQHASQIDTWDFSWMYACLKNGGLTILPELNLVSNLGFGCDATHTTDEQSPLSLLATNRLTKLRHPSEIAQHLAADRWTFENILAPAVVASPDAGGAQSRRTEQTWIEKLMPFKKRPKRLPVG